MKIACVDKTASGRIVLQKFIDEAFEQCRHSIGHTAFAQTYPASQHEILLNSAPDVIVVGYGYTNEESYIACREVSQVHPGVPLFAVLQPESFSLRTLRRFERVCKDVFTKDESPVRLVHRLCAYKNHVQEQTAGRLVVVNGAKGGIGTTSIVSGLAHAAQAKDMSSIVVDLSEHSVFAQYMSVDRWYSPEMASIVVDKLVPDESIARRCIAEAPNGINVLLPPSGGRDVREMWLRDTGRFEIILSAIEVLKEFYDLVLVDVAGVEGILTFALQARAHHRIIVTSNQAASVHLLNSIVSDALEVPGDGRLHVLVNQIQDRGLTKEDVLDFLFVNESFDESMAEMPVIGFDKRAQNWIGSENTFYTEASRQTQRVLENIVGQLVQKETAEEKAKASLSEKIVGAVKRRRVGKQEKIEQPKKDKATLALPEGLAEENGEPVIQMAFEEAKEKPQSEAQEPRSDEDVLLYQSPEVASDSKIKLNGDARQ